MIVTYLKCVWENPFTRIGYAFLLMPLLFWFRPLPLSLIELCVSAVLLLGTGFGKGTMVGYMKTKGHIRKFDGVRFWFLELITGGGYCVNVGVMLALKEYMQRQLRAQE